jgi:hypothetical protein
MSAGLHELYLVTLVIAFVATAVSFPAGLDWRVAGTAVGLLTVRRSLLPLAFVRLPRWLAHETA